MAVKAAKRRVGSAPTFPTCDAFGSLIDVM
jgi:hypothetical protein